VKDFISIYEFELDCLSTTEFWQNLIISTLSGLILAVAASVTESNEVDSLVWR
jgi:hypothetical protein